MARSVGYHKRWAKANPGKGLAASKKFYAAHRSVVLARLVEANSNGARRAILRARTAAWRAANPEKIKEYRTSHPHVSRAGTANHRARRVNAPGGGITAAERRELAAASLGLCAYCNERRPLELDHIEPLALGGEHSNANAAMACRGCNGSKGDTSLLLWLAGKTAPALLTA